MGRIVKLLLSAVMAASTALIAGCQSPRPDTHADSLDGIVHARIVRVCSIGDYEPLTYVDSQGQWSGLDIDLAHDLASRLGVTLQLVQTTWSNIISDLDNRCDLAMGGISITLDRAQRARFSDPYLQDGKAAIARCGDVSKYGGLADIDRPGIRVVVNPGGTNADFDRANLHRATIVNHADNNTIFDEIITGKADVMITDATEIRWQAKQHPQLCGVAVDKPFNFTQKAYLIHRGAAMLQQWVNQWLNLVMHDGTYASISRKWLGLAVGP
ncbi:cyclohexadienyl dehydratase [Mycobacterium sherrisii]|nr:transporter substrate-binding domain-containing protein [Mycobacterium sherrisii]MCV7031042.1 transporter substrate-binding domain-containing protein [Mycobacterium sherrisii]ORW79357.1 cyclohexadienyl dehydratase [Mycobacterium sherrisii]